MDPYSRRQRPHHNPMTWELDQNFVDKSGNCVLLLSICACRQLFERRLASGGVRRPCIRVDRVVTSRRPLFKLPTGKAGFEPGSTASRIVDHSTIIPPSYHHDDTLDASISDDHWQKCNLHNLNLNFEKRALHPPFVYVPVRQSKASW